MPAAKYDLFIEQGATWKLHITVQGGAGTVDLTGYTARMQVRPTVADSTVLAELTTENGKIFLGGTDGTLDIVISATETASYTWTNGVYDLELVSAAGEVTRLTEGSVRVKPEVTR